MNAFQVFLWGALPYIAIATFVVGLIWRYRTDKFGWTSRSSELYENVILRAASPLFHYGILLVFAGHAVGLLVPHTWTEAIGVSEAAYHAGAATLGMIAAIMTIVGIAGLIYRRRRNRAVFLATTRTDKAMYVLLALPILLGTWATLQHQVFGSGEGYNYRETISPWLRSVFVLQPDIALMADVPFAFKLHTLAGLLFMMVIPFTRLVHMFSAPVGYTSRPYLVYRSRDASVATAEPARGWQPVSTQRSQGGAARSRGA